MINSDLRKGLVIAIIVPLIGMSFFPSTELLEIENKSIDNNSSLEFGYIDPFEAYKVINLNKFLSPQPSN